MIEIDGSYGEGGGQVLRTAVSMAAVLGKEVKISDIRAGRPTPGMMAQHVTSVDAVARLSDAEVEGLFVGSKEVVFRPGRLVGGEFEFDIGTAGSIPLVVQACLLPAALSSGVVSIIARGGTDVKWSPPVDYLTLVHAPLAAKFGVLFDMDVVHRGFYPEGGGEVKVEIHRIGGLKGARVASRGDVSEVAGTAFSQNLPEHVTKRLKHAAMKRLVDIGQVRIAVDARRGHSTGAGIVLAARCENTVVGVGSLGEKGVPAERVGETCADDLSESLASGATVDEYALDQVLAYMAVASSPSSFLVEEITPHAETNMWVIEKFVGRRFTRRQAGRLIELSTV